MAKTSLKSKTPASMLGWHFIRKDRTLGYKDGRTVEVGERLEMQYRSWATDRIIKTPQFPCVCQTGMHASERIIQAFTYPLKSNDLWLCRVLVEGDLQKGDDKFCGRFRTVQAMTPFEVIAKKVILEFFEKRVAEHAKDGDKMLKIVTEYLDSGCANTPEIQTALETVKYSQTKEALEDMIRSGTTLWALFCFLEADIKTSVKWFEDRLVYHFNEATKA